MSIPASTPFKELQASSGRSRQRHASISAAAVTGASGPASGRTQATTTDTAELWELDLTFLESSVSLTSLVAAASTH